MIIYVYFQLIFSRPTKGGILDLALSQYEQIWHLIELLAFKYCTPILAFELRLQGPILYRVLAP